MGGAERTSDRAERTSDSEERVDLFGIEVSCFGLADAVEECRRRIRERRGGYACFVNVHTLTGSSTDLQLRASLRQADYCFADGTPLLWLSELKGAPIVQRVCGPDFMDAMLQVERHRCHGFLGGTNGSAEKLAARYGVDSIVHSPPMRGFSEQNALEDWDRFLTACKGKPPAIVWVGLGAPKQELWMRTVQAHAPDVLFLGVGAAFDFLSGTKPRAPRWLQRTGLEWAHRLSSDPKRLWKRYLTSNARFALLCIRELIKTRDG